MSMLSWVDARQADTSLPAPVRRAAKAAAWGIGMCATIAALWSGALVAAMYWFSIVE